MIYIIAVYYRDTAGILHHHKNWKGEADSVGDAKYQAMLDVLADEKAPSRSRSWKAEFFPDQQGYEP